MSKSQQFKTNLKEAEMMKVKRKYQWKHINGKTGELEDTPAGIDWRENPVYLQDVYNQEDEAYDGLKEFFEENSPYDYNEFSLVVSYYVER
jgi:hypothetical protein